MMTDLELSEFLAALKKLRDQLDIIQVYIAPLLSTAPKTEDSLKDVRTTITEVATRIAPNIPASGEAGSAVRND